MASEPSVKYTSATHSIQLIRVTSTNETFIQFTSDFSGDVDISIIQDSKWKKREFFNDLTKYIANKKKKDDKNKKDDKK